MAIENGSEGPLPDEQVVIEERSDMLDDEDNLVHVDEFLEQL